MTMKFLLILSSIFAGGLIALSVYAEQHNLPHTQEIASGGLALVAFIVGASLICWAIWNMDK